MMSRKHFPRNLKCYDMKILTITAVHKFVSTVHLAIAFLIYYKGNTKNYLHNKNKNTGVIFPSQVHFSLNCLEGI